MIRLKILLLGMVLVISCCKLYSQLAENVQAPLIVRTIALYNNISLVDGGVSIHVVDNPSLVEELKKGIGQAIGSSTLKAVTSGGMPTTKPSVIYVSKESNVAEVIAYSQANKILSVTGNPDLITKGVCLGFGVEDNKPKILLNLSSTRDEGIDWNPAILRIATRID